LGGNRKILGKTVKDKVRAGNFNSFITMLIGGLWHGASWNFVIWGALNGAGMIVYKVWNRMNWHIKMSLITVLLMVVYYLRATQDLPAMNLFLIWVFIIWIGALIQYIYWWYKNIKNSIRVASLWAKITSAIGTVWAIAQTFVFITFTRLFFRSGSNLDPATANQEAWETAKNMVNQIGGAWNSSIIPNFLWEYRYVVTLFVVGMLIHWLPTRIKRWYRVYFALMPVWAMILIAVLTIVIVYQFITADMQPFIYFQF
jgi:hypothetical protein